MDFPVLEERAEERYHKQQSKTNPTVDAEGIVNPLPVFGRGEVWDECGDEEGRSLFRRVVVVEGESEEERWR